MGEPAPSHSLAPRDVLDFWFAAGPEKWFTKDDAFDAEIEARFGDAVARARQGAFDAWTATPEGALALVVLLDQFPRNLFRDSAEAFASDDRACAVAAEAIARKFDTELPETARRWFYIPFMHSERLADQERCVDLVRERMPGDKDTLHFAELHRDLIERFGRFPHRNAVIGRRSSQAELDYLAEPDAFKG